MTKPFDTDYINEISWRCERFDETGKTGEVDGDFSLSLPLSREEFAEYDKQQMDELIFANVDKSAVEASLTPAG